MAVTPDMIAKADEEFFFGFHGRHYYAHRRAAGCFFDGFLLWDPDGNLRLHALDVGAEVVELFIDRLVAAVDVVNAVDLRGSIGLQAREH